MLVGSNTILITGGESGIGAALAKAFSLDGHVVIICGLREERLLEVSKANGNIHSYVCDVSDEERIVVLKDLIKGKVDRIDVIINCAGIYGPIGRFDKTDSHLWSKTFQTNFFGVYLIIKHFLPHLTRSNLKKIINFAGGGAFNPLPSYSAYAVSKTAVVRFTETIAVELSSFGVKVHCVAPGFVATEIHNSTLEAGEELAGEGYKFTLEKLKAGAVPMEMVVECVKFLASPEADPLTGKTISVSYDKWNNTVFRECMNRIAQSDLYSLRRINPPVSK